MKKLKYLSVAILIIALSGIVGTSAYAGAAGSAVSVYGEQNSKNTTKISWSEVFAKNKNVLKSAYANASGGYATFRVGANGRITAETNDEYTLARFLCDMELILSEEGFKQYGSRYTSRGEYTAAMLKDSEYAMFFNDNGELLNPPEPALHFRIYCRSYSEEVSDEQVFMSSAKFLLSQPDGVELNPAVTAAFESGKDFFCDSNCRYSDKTALSVAASFFRDSDKPEKIEETISADGDSGIFISGQFISADTEKLFVTSRDKSTALMLAGFSVPEDCVFLTGSENGYTDTFYDFEEIAQKLPDLKELYMYQAQGENQSAISKLTKLEALSYYVTDDPYSTTSTTNDFPFAKLTKLKTLNLYGDYEDFSFLNGIKWLKTLRVNTSAFKSNIKSLLNCPAVTSLELSGWSSECRNIYKLKNLKTLKLSGGNIDFAAIGKLKKLKELEVRCYRDNKNISELSKLDKLTSLTLSTIDCRDWSFLKEMNSLTNLSLFYSDNVKNKDIAGIKKLTSLSLIYTQISDFKGSKTLERFEESLGSCIDYSAFTKCLKLKELAIFGSDSPLDCKYLAKLPLENIWCDGTKVLNAGKLCGVKTLKNITIAIADDDFAYAETLRAALPDCEINLNNEPFYNNFY